MPRLAPELPRAPHLPCRSPLALPVMGQGFIEVAVGPAASPFAHVEDGADESPEALSRAEELAAGGQVLGHPAEEQSHETIGHSGGLPAAPKAGSPGSRFPPKSPPPPSGGALTWGPEAGS